MSDTPLVCRDRNALWAARREMPGTVGVVTTMGALHDGHAALLRAARQRCDHVLVTIFVNPLQFGPTEDLDRYPRPFEADLAVCAAEGVDVVFAPSVDEMYPTGQPAVRVDPGPVGEILEGASRPGFFTGVLTVVSKLIHLTRPHRVYFGEKDYQQLTLVRALVRDLDLLTDGAPVEVVAVPTVREPDGLARSSRNVYLSADERRASLALSAALRAGQAAAGDGADALLSAARQQLDGLDGAAGVDSVDGAAGVDAVDGAAGVDAVDGAAGVDSVDVDYLVLTDPDLGPAPVTGPGRLLIAARVGTTRLIDNLPVLLGHEPTER